MTEIFLLIKNLVENGLYDDEGVILEINLNGAYNRELVFMNLSRELHHVYQCKILEEIKINKALEQNDIISNTAGLAMDTTIEVFERFNWTSPRIREILRDEQEEFIEGSL